MTLNMHDNIVLATTSMFLLAFEYACAFAFAVGVAFPFEFAFVLSLHLHFVFGLIHYVRILCI